MTRNMTRFVELRMRDFRAFEGEQRIKFMPDRTMILEGNAEGMTSIRHAMALCLGCLDWRERHEVNFSAFQAGRDSTRVELDFESDGNRYRAVREFLGAGTGRETNSTSCVYHLGLDGYELMSPRDHPRLDFLFLTDDPIGVLETLERRSEVLTADQQDLIASVAGSNFEIGSTHSLKDRSPDGRDGRPWPQSEVALLAFVRSLAFYDVMGVYAPLIFDRFFGSVYESHLQSMLRQLDEVRFQKIFLINATQNRFEWEPDFILEATAEGSSRVVKTNA